MEFRKIVRNRGNKWYSFKINIDIDAPNYSYARKGTHALLKMITEGIAHVQKL